MVYESSEVPTRPADCRSTVGEGSVRCSVVPREPGTYVLVMRLRTSTEVTVGKLGVFTLGSGWYHYVGSALGPGGLCARLARHRRKRKRRHWHIDYLVHLLQMREIWWASTSEHVECVWAHALLGLPYTTVPVPGFGSSDCRCPSHLLYSQDCVPFSTVIAQLAGAGIPGLVVHRWPVR